MISIINVNIIKQASVTREPWKVALEVGAFCITFNQTIQGIFLSNNTHYFKKLLTFFKMLDP